ncbi:hypothetical protein [Acinetobacter sp. ANC 4805]|uniref:hypothetical protein n=1 Tax=Acinetobacter sp. ANC 4805 TaxID=2923425 RepID=UPI001F4B3BFF|nr:hypothetical protein [Acinetobacter sp. ANC 4805]MCH7310521.1 hypothetical protein [Acinetobacter sp. ANC 4805]
MPRLNDVQNTALEIIDFLYFYDMVALQSFTEEKKDIYTQLDELIDEVLEEKQLTGQKAVIYRHYLLCGIEIVSSFDKNHKWQIPELNLNERQQGEIQDQMHKQSVMIPLWHLKERLKKSGRFEGDFVEEVYTLIELSQIDKASHSVCHKLVAQMLWFNVEHNVACHVYRRMVTLRILNSAKDTAKGRYVEAQHEYVFLRALLLVEFESFRKELYYRPVAGDLVVNKSRFTSSEINSKKKVYYHKYLEFSLSDNRDGTVIHADIDLADKRQVIGHLSLISEHLFHNCIFSNSNANWISLLGALLLIYEQEIDLDRAIYSEFDNENSCSDRAQKILFEKFDFSVTAKSLYLNYLEVYKIYDLIRSTMVDVVEQPKHGFLVPDLTSHFYYHADIPTKVLELLEEVKR